MTAEQHRSSAKALAATGGSGRRVFLSYAHEDQASMVLVRDALAVAGFVMWTDEHLVAGSPGWAAQIEAAIDEADVVVVVLTPAAKASPWVANEVHYAVEQEVPILPVLAAGPAKASVPITLIGYHRIALDPGDTPGDLAPVLRHDIAALSPTHRPAAPPSPASSPPRLPTAARLPPRSARTVGTDSRYVVPSAGSVDAAPPGPPMLRVPPDSRASPVAARRPSPARLGLQRHSFRDIVMWFRNSLGPQGRVLPAGIAPARIDVVSRRYGAFVVDALVSVIIAAALTSAWGEVQDGPASREEACQWWSCSTRRAG